MRLKVQKGSVEAQQDSKRAGFVEKERAEERRFNKLSYGGGQGGAFGHNFALGKSQSGSQEQYNKGGKKSKSKKKRRTHTTRRRSRQSSSSSSESYDDAASSDYSDDVSSDDDDDDDDSSDDDSGDDDSSDDGSSDDDPSGAAKNWEGKENLLLQPKCVLIDVGGGRCPRRFMLDVVTVMEHRDPDAYGLVIAAPEYDAQKDNHLNNPSFCYVASDDDDATKIWYKRDPTMFERLMRSAGRNGQISLSKKDYRSFRKLSNEDTPKDAVARTLRQLGKDEGKSLAENKSDGSVHVQLIKRKRSEEKKRKKEKIKKGTKKKKGKRKDNKRKKSKK